MDVESQALTQYENSERSSIKSSSKTNCLKRNCNKMTLLICGVCLFLIAYPFIFLLIGIILLNSEFHITIVKINNTINPQSEIVETHQLNLVEPYFRIKTRAEWGAAPSNRNLTKFKSPADRIIISQTNSIQCDDFETCKIQALMAQQFFFQYTNFENIGYNFLIGGDGTVYEGLGWDYVGYHTKGFNKDSIGIAFIGNYQINKPTENQLSATKLLIDNGLENHKINFNYKLVGQRDLTPTLRSPGDELYKKIKVWNHYNTT